MENYSEPRLGAVGANGKWGQNTITVAPEGIQMKSLAKNGVWEVELGSGRVLQMTQEMEKVLAAIFFAPSTERVTIHDVQVTLNMLSVGEILELKERFIELHAPYVRVECRAERLPYATENGAVAMVCCNGVTCLISPEDDRILFDALILKNKRSVKTKLERMAMMCFDTNPSNVYALKEGVREIKEAYLSMYGVSSNPLPMPIKILLLIVCLVIVPYGLWKLLPLDSYLSLVGWFGGLIYLKCAFYAVVSGWLWSFLVGDIILKRQIKKLLPNE